MSVNKVILITLIPLLINLSVWIFAFCKMLDSLIKWKKLQKELFYKDLSQDIVRNYYYVFMSFCGVFVTIFFLYKIYLLWE